MTKLVQKLTLIFLIALTACPTTQCTFSIKNIFRAWNNQPKKAKWAQGAVLAGLTGGALYYYFKIYKPKKAAEYQVKKQNYRERIKNLIASNTQDNQKIIQLIDEYKTDYYKNAGHNFYYPVNNAHQVIKNFAPFSSEISYLARCAIEHDRQEILEYCIPLLKKINSQDTDTAMKYYGGWVKGYRPSLSIEDLLEKAYEYREKHPEPKQIYDYLLIKYCEDKFNNPATNNSATSQNVVLEYDAAKGVYSICYPTSPLLLNFFLTAIREGLGSSFEKVLSKYYVDVVGITKNLLMFHNEKYVDELISLKNKMIRHIWEGVHPNPPYVTRKNLDIKTKLREADQIINNLALWYFQSDSETQKHILVCARTFGHEAILQEAINKRTMYKSTDAFDLNFNYKCGAV